MEPSTHPVIQNQIWQKDLYISQDVMLPSPEFAAKQLVLRMSRQAIVNSFTEKEEGDYYKKILTDVASVYGKHLMDFSITDVKRVMDSLHSLFVDLKLENKYFSEFGQLRTGIEAIPQIPMLIKIAEASGALSYSSFSWLAKHISVAVHPTRLKLGATSFILGCLAMKLYGRSVEPIGIRHLELQDGVLDPLVQELDRPSLATLAHILDLQVHPEQTDVLIAQNISKKLASESRDQSITRSWFPKDAESYLEVLTTLAKLKNLDIRGLNDVQQLESAHSVALFKSIWDRIDLKHKFAVESLWKLRNEKLSPDSLLLLNDLAPLSSQRLSWSQLYLVTSTLIGVAARQFHFHLSPGMGLPLDWSSLEGEQPTSNPQMIPDLEFLNSKTERVSLAVAFLAMSRSKTALKYESRLKEIEDENTPQLSYLPNASFLKAIEPSPSVLISVGVGTFVLMHLFSRLRSDPSGSSDV